MLPAKPNLWRVALNRITFGARDTDVTTVAAMGWTAWVDEQLYPPPGDDPALDAFLKSQTMNITYPAANPVTQPGGTWAAVNENRPLNYLNAEIPALWDIYLKSGSTLSFAERTRIRQELMAATWIRNTHSKYQVREFMVDFWHNHFNIGKNENEMATTLLPAFDRLTIRPNALGNFRTLLGATAKASSMLTYLDNWLSTSTTPNENYAREIMELHTLGGGAYYGTAAPSTVPTANGVALGFTDQDILHASRALSGWTIKAGQRIGNTVLPSTGEFVYNAPQHNTQAGTVLGVSLVGYPGQSQGEKFLDIIAAHPAVAPFIVTKIAKRFFGDAPPQTVIDRGIATWNANQTAPDQIAKTLRSMIHDGYNELFYEAPTKVRRPYERLIAFARTTDTVINASTIFTTLLDSVNDGLFAWQAPNGRPDVNSYWLATGATITTWNWLQQFMYFPTVKATLAAQTPETAMTTSTALVEYWVDRMVGMTLSTEAMNALIAEQAGNVSFMLTQPPNSAANILESIVRRVASLITTTEEFTLR